MSLPETIRVKLSTEVAESISLTPVVVRDLPLRELMEHMLGITGKDEERVHELLLRGTLVSGASRFRWTGWDANRDGIRGMLASFPDSEPGRPFQAETCTLVVMSGPKFRVEIPREAAIKKPLLRRTSFWQILMDVGVRGNPQYSGYSYKDRADWYRLDLSPPAADHLRSGAKLLRYATLRGQISRAPLRTLAFAQTR
ncbi:MAG: hypothetical protein EXQ52_05630 [Bryobacterales bacterium]|nr:hypothetical protein [Bryobacterales bacterium]